MSKNLKDIIDLNKYPIHDLNSVKIKHIIKKCKSGGMLFTINQVPLVEDTDEPMKPESLLV